MIKNNKECGEFEPIAKDDEIDEQEQGFNPLFNDDNNNNNNGSDGSDASNDNNRHQRRLTLVDGVAILVGIIIGSGIFSSPGLALERCGSPGEVLIAWTVSGILVILAANCYMGNNNNNNNNITYNNNNNPTTKTAIIIIILIIIMIMIIIIITLLTIIIIIIIMIILILITIILIIILITLKTKIN